MKNNTEFGLEELMNANSLKEFLDVDKALVFGANLDVISMFPGFPEKFGDEIDAFMQKINNYKDNLSNIQDSLDPELTLEDFIDKAIASYESEEDKVNVAILMGMYVAHCFEELNE